MKYLVLSISLVVFLLSPIFVQANEESNVIVSDSWMEEAIRNIEKEEYRPSLQESDYKGEQFDTPKYHFVNRANNLRAYFTENEFELLPRVMGEENWSLKITSIAINNYKKSLKASELGIAGDNILCAGKDIKVTYSNSESGIRQNLVIEENNRVEGNISIDLIIETENLDITAEEDKFVLKSGEKEITYKINKIEDGDEKDISYSLMGERGKLSILLYGDDVIYPIKVLANITSPNSSNENLNLPTSAKVRGLSGTPDWTAESNQVEAYFGWSVSSAGDVNGDGYSDVIVGAYWYDNGETREGRAYVYHGSSSGLSSVPDWTAESNQAYADFGHSVSTAGDVNGDGYSDVIVGAYDYDNGETNEGRAYLYHGSSSGLSASPDWIAESDQAGAYFGQSVSSAGDVNGDGYSDVIVGAGGYDNGETDEGGAFVYYGSFLGLSSSPDWTGESDQASAYCGVSVSSAGDVNGDGYSDVIVGAPGYDNGETDEGRAYLYHGSSSGLSSVPDWTAESNQAGADFGTSVFSAGDVNADGYSDVIVGADWYDNGETDEGRAYLYHGSSSGLSPSPDWTAESNQAEAYFGCSVSSAGDVNGDGYSDVIVGAYFYENGETNEGRAYLYHGSSSGLSSVPDWTAESNQIGGGFGYSVSSVGDVNGDGYSDVIVGAPGYDNGETGEGRAYLYHGSSSGLSASPDWTAESNQADAYFGYSVSSAGDVNGDGYSDVIVGAYYYDHGETNEGVAFVFNGSSSGLSTSPDWTAESDQVNAEFGYSVSTAGDVNGDGYSDVIVGASRYNNGESNEGRTFVYHGSPGGLSASPNWTAESDQVNGRFGRSVSSAGDVNGDGYSDVIVGTDSYDNGEVDEGSAFVYHGSSGGLSATADWTAESDQDTACFGSSVSSAGDVNGDGFSDVIIGASLYDNGERNEGGAFVYHGSTGGLSASADWTAEPDQVEAYFGWSVSSAGDVNGDGYSDVIVGALRYDNGQSDEGGAFVYHGSSSGLSATADWTAESDQALARFGNSVSTAGDVNGDGYSDVIVGAYTSSNGQANEGRAFVFNGNSGGLSASADWTGESDQSDAQYGVSVSSAGDVNGDGYSDVIVGAFLYDNGQTNEGGAFVYCGNGEGLSLTPAQSTADGSHLVQLGNATGTSGVQLNILGRTPGGRGKVKLQWEVKELGELFDGTAISESASWYDTDTNGIEISEDVTGLSEATAYHWRVRLKYDPVTYNDLLYSRWLSIGPNGWNEIDFITTSLSGIEDNTDESANIQLSVFPSISTNIFSIRFSVSEEEAEEDISLRVYNKAGILVKNLFTGKKPGGIHTITLNGKKLPNDVYFISLKKGTGKNSVRKVVLLR